MFNKYLTEAIQEHSVNEYVPHIILNEKTYHAYKKYAFDLPMELFALTHRALFVVNDEMEDEVAEVW